VSSHHKLPKQLLQQSLKPILVNLAYYNKLRLPLLHGLARLLSLLASWFNVALGKFAPWFESWLSSGIFQSFFLALGMNFFC
jgi:transformation/transcription domain-associated protein